MTTIIYAGNVWRRGKSSVNIVKYFSDVQVRVLFKDRRNNQSTYKYQRKTIGPKHIKKIIELANEGKGLNTYIHKYKLKGIRE